MKFWLLAVALLTAACALNASALENKLTLDLGNKVSLEMVLIPAGAFTMGSGTGDRNEQPAHKVTLTKAFYLATTEITQLQYLTLMGTNCAKFVGLQNPVDSVNRRDCQLFARKLSTMFKGRRFRLPTEAEWEYACRAGSQTDYCFGSDPAQLGDYAWYGPNSGTSPHPVAAKKPNAWGLFDMHGSVMEWCSDGYVHDYPAGDQTDPRGDKDSEWAVVRGGAWKTGPKTCRSSARIWLEPVNRLVIVGFRIACDAELYNPSK